MALGCLVGGVVGLGLFHGTQIATGLSLIPGDEIDARFVSYIAEHLYQASLGRASLVSPGMYFPVEGTLAYSDIHLLTAVVHGILRAAGLPMLAATGAAIVLLTAATWIVTYLFFATGLGFRPVAAMIGAYFFVFSSPKLNQMSHLQHQVLPLIPAMAWCIVAFVRRAGAGDPPAWWPLILFSLFLHLQLWTSFQIAWFWIFYLSVALALVLAKRAPRTAALGWGATHARGLVLLAAANLALLVPFAAFYSRAATDVGWRSWGEILPSLPRPWSYLSMGSNLIWGWLPKAMPKLTAMPLPWEQALGVGLVGSLVLAVSYGWALVRYTSGEELFSDQAGNAGWRRDLVVVLSLSSFVLFVVTLNLHYVSLWHVIYAAVPGAAAVRTVSRYVLISALGTAMFLAYALDRFIDQSGSFAPGRRLVARILVALLAVGLVAEQAGRPPSFDRNASQAHVGVLIAQLRANPTCEVFAIALPGPKGREGPAQLDAMLASVQTGIPTVNGYSSFGPPGWTLWDLRSPGYAARVSAWASSRHLRTSICVLAVAR